MEEEFRLAVERVRKLGDRPSDETLLKLYGLYKQATVGPNRTPKPSFWDFKGHAKWNAWDSYYRLSKEEAKRNYISLVNSLFD